MSQALSSCPFCKHRLAPAPREIRELRTAAGLIQDQLGTMLDISGPHVAFLEAGKRRMSAELTLTWLKLVPRLQKLIDRRVKTLTGVRKVVIGVEGNGRDSGD